MRVVRNKRGNILPDQTVKVIMAVVIVIAIFLLMIRLFSPVFDQSDKTAESYFESLEVAIADADPVGSTGFIMLDNGDKNLNFYLVYFGGLGEIVEVGYMDSFSTSIGPNIKRKFSRSKFGQNVICICSEKKVGRVCDYCKNLDLPAMLPGVNNPDGWFVGEGVRMKINKRGGAYDFVKW